MTRHRILVQFGVLFITLLLFTSQSQASVRLNLDSNQYQASHRQYTVNHGVVFMKPGEFLRMAKGLGLKVHTLKLSKPDLEKLAKSSAKGCGCGAPVDDEDYTGLGRCFKNCMMDAGVSYATVVTCAGVCGATLIGCAICVGVGETIVMACSLACAWAPLFSKNIEGATPLTPKPGLARVHRPQVAKLSLKAARSGSSR